VKTPYNSIAGRPLAKAEIGGEKTNYYYDPKATDFYIPLDSNLLDLTPPIQANPPQCNLFQGSALASSSSSGNSRTLVSSASPVSAASCHAASSHWGFFNNADFTDRPSSTITSQSGAGTTSSYSRSSSRAMLSDGASPNVPIVDRPIEVDAFYDRFFNPPSSIRGEEGLERAIVSPRTDTEAILFAQLGLKPAQQKTDSTLLQNIFFYLPDPNDKSVQRGNLLQGVNFYSTTGVYNPDAPTVYVPLTPELLSSGATYKFQLDPKVDLEHRQIAIGIQKPIYGSTQVAMQVTNQATGEVSSLSALRKIPYEVKITPVRTGYVYTPEGARYIQPPFTILDTKPVAKTILMPHFKIESIKLNSGEELLGNGWRWSGSGLDLGSRISNPATPSRRFTKAEQYGYVPGFSILGYSLDSSNKVYYLAQRNNFNDFDLNTGFNFNADTNILDFGNPSSEFGFSDPSFNLGSIPNSSSYNNSNNQWSFSNNVRLNLDNAWSGASGSYDNLLSNGGSWGLTNLEGIDLLSNFSTPDQFLSAGDYDFAPNRSILPSNAPTVVARYRIPPRRIPSRTPSTQTQPVFTPQRRQAPTGYPILRPSAPSCIALPWKTCTPPPPLPSSISTPQLIKEIRDTFGIPEPGSDSLSTVDPQTGSPRNQTPEPEPQAEADGAGAREGGNSRREVPDWLRDQWNRGNEFNRIRRPAYPYNEIRIKVPGNKDYSVLDSYNPRTGEIVSRKFTQFSNIQEQTAINYVNEIGRKYEPGFEIADVPSVPRELKGERLRGRKILEVPVQVRPIPQAILDAASNSRVIIRDVNGRVYNP
jgi:hypothetical protein